MKKLFVAFLLCGALFFPLVGCKSGAAQGNGNGTGTEVAKKCEKCGKTPCECKKEKAAVCEKCKKEGKEKCDCPK